MNIISKIKENPFIYVSYFNALFFVEIINIMFILLISYGKLVAIIVSCLLTLLLSAHIILLYFGKEFSRKLQLILMDLHVAYFLPFIFLFLIYYEKNSIYDYILPLVRFIMICAEIFFIVTISTINRVELKAK
jgi:hypothetical protein